MSIETMAIIIGIPVCFIGLLITHYLALKIGWRMGTKVEPAASLPSLRKKSATDYTEKPDIYDEERLDFD